MGIFDGSAPDSDSYSRDKSEDQDGKCPNCGAAYHSECLKNIGNVKKESRLIRGDAIKAKCPNCGNVGKW